MKCPKCKKKLQTKRTIDTDTQTKREKFCKKCKTTFDTFEMFKDTFENYIKQKDDHFESLDNDLSKMTMEKEEIVQALKIIVATGQKK